MPCFIFCRKLAIIYEAFKVKLIKNVEAVMKELVFFLFGLMIGGGLATAIILLLQLDRINKYEIEILKLKTAQKHKSSE